MNDKKKKWKCDQCHSRCSITSREDPNISMDCEFEDKWIEEGKWIKEKSEPEPKPEKSRLEIWKCELCENKTCFGSIPNENGSFHSPIRCIGERETGYNWIFYGVFEQVKKPEPEPERFRLVIPDNPHKDLHEFVKTYKKHDGLEVLNTVANCVIEDGLREWLVKIEDPEGRKLKLLIDEATDDE